MTNHLVFEVGIFSFSLLLGVFCFLLTRRLKKLNDLETGLGGAIAIMVMEIDRLDGAIHAAASEADRATKDLALEVGRAKIERELWELQNKFLSGRGTAEQRRSLRRSRRKQGAINA